MKRPRLASAYRVLVCQAADCWVQFNAVRPDAKFCCAACRSREFRRRGRATPNYRDRLLTIQRLHRRRGDRCGGCGNNWPCDTIRIIYNEPLRSAQPNEYA